MGVAVRRGCNAAITGKDRSWCSVDREVLMITFHNVRGNHIGVVVPPWLLRSAQHCAAVPCLPLTSLLSFMHTTISPLPTQHLSAATFSYWGERHDQAVLSQHIGGVPSGCGSSLLLQAVYCARRCAGTVQRGAQGGRCCVLFSCLARPSSACFLAPRAEPREEGDTGLEVCG